MDALALIAKYYPEDSKAYEILVSHSRQVADKAVGIALLHPEMNLDVSFLQEASLLHDIGIFRCNAPEIGCFGDAEYICHGYIGAELMRSEGFPRHARVCERHTGTGITLAAIEERHLPLPLRDFMPETLEEQLICFADKFFSKTKLDQEKPVDKIRKGLSRYGADSVERFDVWHKRFLGE